jgi:ABC-type multidrug transport system ATPase subunit
VAGGVNQLTNPENAVVMITHYQRLLNYIVPDYVHVMADGRIITTGGKELAERLESEGYEDIWQSTKCRGGSVMTIQVSNSETATQPTKREQREAYLKSLLSTAQANVSPIRLWPLPDLRAKAEAIVNEHTFPSSRDEDWRFTDLSPMLDGAVPGGGRVQGG